MASDNIFSGLKVVDLASFIAGPGTVLRFSLPGTGNELTNSRRSAPDQLVSDVRSSELQANRRLTRL